MARELSIASGDGEEVAFVTCPSLEVAENLATALVESGACACVNIVPGIKSVYRWEGVVCRDEELLLVIKSDQTRRQLLLEQLMLIHPYTEPELIFLPISAGSKTYLDWVRAR